MSFAKHIERFLRVGGAAVVVGAAVLASAPAASGRAVATVPSNGRVFGAINGPRGTALVLQPGSAGITVARYLPNGKLDESFGRHGIAFDPRSTIYLEGHLAPGPDGTIIASSSESITRFTADGRIDRTYGKDGQILRDQTRVNIGLATNIVLANGATIAVSPTFNIHPPIGIVATRYRPDGRIDRRYGDDGRAFAPVWNDDEPVTAITMQADRLLMLSHGEGAGRLYLTRLTPDGRVDKSFGTDGRAEAISRRIKGHPVGMVLQPDGAIVVVTTGNRFLRFGPDGERDWSFGNQGVATGPAPNATIRSLAVAPDGSLIAAGAAIQDKRRPPGSIALVAERLTPSGTVDPSFGAGTGYVTVSLGPETYAGARAAVLPETGRLFLAGQVANSKGIPFGAKILLAALEPDGTPAADFGRNGTIATRTISLVGGRKAGEEAEADAHKRLRSSSATLSSAVPELFRTDRKAVPDTTITFGPTGWTNLTNPVFRYEASDPEARFECRLDEALFHPCGLSEEEARGDGPEGKLSQGRHSFEVRAVSAEGIADPSPARSRIIVDTEYPTARILSGPERVTHLRRPSFRLEVTEEDSFWCSIGGRSAAGMRVRLKVRSCDGPHSFRPPRPLADGRYSFHLIASDRAGNEQIESRSFSIVG